MRIKSKAGLEKTPSVSDFELINLRNVVLRTPKKRKLNLLSNSPSFNYLASMHCKRELFPSKTTHQESSSTTVTTTTTMTMKNNQMLIGEYGTQSPFHPETFYAGNDNERVDSQRFAKKYKIIDTIEDGSNSNSGACVSSAVTTTQIQDEDEEKKEYAVKSVQLNNLDANLKREMYHEIHTGFFVGQLAKYQVTNAFSGALEWFKFESKQMLVSEKATERIINRLLCGLVEKCNLRYIKSIMAQLLHALEVGQQWMELVHYDLHPDNVLVKHMDHLENKYSGKPNGWLYERANGHTMFIPSTDHQYDQVRIVDFSRTRAIVPHVNAPKEYRTLRWNNEMEEYGIVRQFHRQHDMRNFAVNLAYRMAHNSILRMQVNRWKKEEPQQYCQWITLMDYMMGTRYLRRALDSPTMQTLFEDHDEPEKNQADVIKILSNVNSVQAIFDTFNEASDIKIGNNLCYMLQKYWAWTSFSFPHTVTDALCSPFFDNYHNVDLTNKEVFKCAQYRVPSVNEFVTPAQERTLTFL